MNNKKRRMKNVYTTSFKTAPPPQNIGCSRAFTLAEVLITLGIIGVVAALTLPSLMAKYQKMVYVNQLKKSYSVVTNGFKKMMADDGVDKLSDTSYFAACDRNNGCILDDLKKYFNIIKTKGNIVYFADGSYVALDLFTSPDGPYNTYFKNCDSLLGSMNIDTNGDKAPNKIGYDQFGFILCDSGHLGTAKNFADLLLSANGQNIESMLEQLKQESYSGCPNGDSLQLSLLCSSRVIDYDNWQIKY